MSTSAWISVPHDSPPPMAGGSAGARARYAPSDFVTLLWRERFLMLVVFLPKGAVQVYAKRLFAPVASIFGRRA